jgi:2-pyrone-4,6-dicarboxylate lactonase
MGDPRPSYLASPSKPKLKLPAGACDTHVHVFGPGRVFPYAKGAPFTPADAPKEKLFALHALLGIRRCVIVQSTCHGYDNRVVADAIAAKNGDYRGVALVPPEVDDAELERLDAQGFCGVRFNFMSHLGKGPSIDEAIALTPRLAKLGWHLQVHFEAALIDELAPRLKRSAVPVVIDHMGRVDASLGVDQSAFRSYGADARRALPRQGERLRAHRASPRHGPTRVPSRALVSEFGDRCFWAATGRTRTSPRSPTTESWSTCSPRSWRREGAQGGSSWTTPWASTGFGMS